MDAPIAQLVALVSHGNRFLREDGTPPELHPTHTTFRWVSAVRFGRLEPGTAPWFDDLRRRGVESLALELDGSDLSRAGRPSEPCGQIHTGPASGEIWSGEWLAGDDSDPDSRVWQIAYGCTPAGDAMTAAESLETASRSLAENLEETERFARGHAVLEPLLPPLVEAREQLIALHPTATYHFDLVPSDWPAPARRLLAAATRAWVFGGNTSWNEVAFSDPAEQREYERLIGRLYAAVCAAIAAGANAESR